MKAKFLSFLFLLLTSLLYAQEYKDILNNTIKIMEVLDIEIRSSFNERSPLPKIKKDNNQINYTAEFNLNIINPIISISNNTYLLFYSPKEYYSKYTKSKIPKQLLLIDSIRHISSIIHETSHFLEDTTNYKFKYLNPNSYCKIGEVFCSVRYPAEFNAYAVCSAFVLSNINNKRFNEIMKMKKTIQEKKVELINEVYYETYKYPDFKRRLLVTDLIN